MGGWIESAMRQFFAMVLAVNLASASSMSSPTLTSVDTLEERTQKAEMLLMAHGFEAEAAVLRESSNRGHGRELGQAVAAANDCADKNKDCSQSWVDDNRCKKDFYWRGQCPKKCKTCQESDQRRRKSTDARRRTSDDRRRRSTASDVFVKNQPSDSPIKSSTSKCVDFYKNNDKGPEKYGTEAASMYWKNQAFVKRTMKAPDRNYHIGYKQGCTVVKDNDLGHTYHMCGCYEQWCPAWLFYGSKPNNAKSKCFSAKGIFGCILAGKYVHDCKPTNGGHAFTEQMVF